MRVYVWPADLYACGHYRMMWPARAIHEAEPDIDVEVVEPNQETSGLRAVVRHGVVQEATCPPDADLLVFQRPTSPVVAGSIPKFREQGVAVVVDIDDDLAHIDPANPAWVMLHPERRTGKLWPHEKPATKRYLIGMVLANGGAQSAEVEETAAELLPEVDKAVGFLAAGGAEGDIRGFLKRLICDVWKAYRMYLTSFPEHSWKAATESAKSATLTMVSTPALTTRYGAGNATVIENYIPARFLDIPHQDSATVGWPGSTHSHPRDLAVLGGLGERLLRDGHRFQVVGDSTGTNLPMTGPVDFHDWPEAVARIGIGVAPLIESRFNEAKSWLKPLELSAVGVPWVASPRPEYVKLAGKGAGVLAEKPKDWLRQVRALVGDEALRVERSQQARDVAAELTIEANAWRTAEVWHRAVVLQRAQRPVGVS